VIAHWGIQAFWNAALRQWRSDPITRSAVRQFLNHPMNAPIFNHQSLNSSLRGDGEPRGWRRRDHGVTFQRRHRPNVPFRLQRHGVGQVGFGSGDDRAFPDRAPVGGGREAHPVARGALDGGPTEQVDVTGRRPLGRLDDLYDAWRRRGRARRGRWRCGGRCRRRGGGGSGLATAAGDGHRNRRGCQHARETRKTTMMHKENSSASVCREALILRVIARERARFCYSPRGSLARNPQGDAAR